jgi:F0F1-type ATP synthase assembly protein I
MARLPSDRKGPTLTTVQALAVASQFGVTLAVSVVLGVLVGQWVDAHLNTGIIFTLIGVVIGIAAAGSSTVRLYHAALRRSEADWHANHPPQHQPQQPPTTPSARNTADAGNTLDADDTPGRAPQP